jgi:hypothetical protein
VEKTHGAQPEDAFTEACRFNLRGQLTGSFPPMRMFSVFLDFDEKHALDDLWVWKTSDSV